MEITDFRKIDIVGKGSFGKAVLVQHVKNRKFYILKIIDVYQMDTKQKQDAQMEIKLLKDLKHPFIISYKGSFIDKFRFLCIVMDYADGGDLYKQITQQKKQGSLFSEDQIMEWFVQICLAIKYIHDKKILHRDLKTQNIFLTKSNHIKLGDFGIARVLQNTCDCAQTQIGTPFYISPEICNSEAYNQKSDIWSLGCVLYELATLRHAFDGKDINIVKWKIMQGKYQEISGQYSAELHQLIRDMLQTNPQSRPSIRKILERDYIKQHLNKLIEKSIINNEMLNDTCVKNLGTNNNSSINNFTSISEEFASNTKNNTNNTAISTKQNLLTDHNSSLINNSSICNTNNSNGSDNQSKQQLQSILKKYAQPEAEKPPAHLACNNYNSSKYANVRRSHNEDFIKYIKEKENLNSQNTNQSKSQQKLSKIVGAQNAHPTYLKIAAEQSQLQQLKQQQPPLPNASDEAKKLNNQLILNSKLRPQVSNSHLRPENPQQQYFSANLPLPHQPMAHQSSLQKLLQPQQAAGQLQPSQANQQCQPGQQKYYQPIRSKSRLKLQQITQEQNGVANDRNRSFSYIIKKKSSMNNLHNQSYQAHKSKIQRSHSQLSCNQEQPSQVQNQPANSSNQEVTFEKQKEIAKISLITIEGKCLPGITDKDSIFQKIESYREYLENQLGPEVFLKTYDLLKENYTNNGSQFKLQSKYTYQLNTLLNKSQIRYIPLIQKIIIYEDSYYTN